MCKWLCIVGGRVVYLYTSNLRRCYDCVYRSPEAVDLSQFFCFVSFNSCMSRSHSLSYTYICCYIMLPELKNRICTDRSGISFADMKTFLKLWCCSRVRGRQEVDVGFNFVQAGQQRMNEKKPWLRIRVLVSLKCNEISSQGHSRTLLLSKIGLEFICRLSFADAELH